MDQFPKGKEIATLACGIASIVLSCYYVGIAAAIVALVFSSQAKNVGYESGMIKAGKICAIVGIVLFAVALIVTIFLGGMSAILGSY